MGNLPQEGPIIGGCFGITLDSLLDFNHPTLPKLRLLLAAGSNPHELELMSRSNALLPACAWDNTQSIEAFLRRSRLANPKQQELHSAKLTFLCCLVCDV